MISPAPWRGKTFPQMIRYFSMSGKMLLAPAAQAINSKIAMALQRWARSKEAGEGRNRPDECTGRYVWLEDKSFVPPLEVVMSDPVPEAEKDRYKWYAQDLANISQRLKWLENKPEGV